MSDDLTTGEGTADLAYRWTVRALYLVAIGLNVWVLWDAVAEDEDTARLKAKVTAWRDRLLDPFRVDQMVKKHTGAVLWEATRIVEDTEDA